MITKLMLRIFPKSWKKPQSVERLILPFKVCGWIVGVGIIEIPTGKLWPVTSLIYMVVQTLFYIFFHNTSLAYDTIGSTLWREQGFFARANSWMTIALIISNNVLGWIRAINVKRVVERFEKSDEKIKKIGIPLDNEFLYLKNAMTIFTELLLIFLFTIGGCNNAGQMNDSVSETFLQLIMIFFPHMQTFFATFTFITLVRSIHARLIELNDNILTISKTTDDLPQHKRALGYTRTKLYVSGESFENRKQKIVFIGMEKACEYHHELGEIARMINDAFTAHVFVSTVVSFVVILQMVLGIMTVVLGLASENPTIQILIWNYFFTLLIEVSKVIVISSACEKASHEAQKTGRIISNLHEVSTEQTLKDEIRTFALQLSQETLEFDACGFFEINHELLKKIVGSVATYLVMLVTTGYKNYLRD